MKTQKPLMMALAGALTLALAACGGGGSDAAKTDDTAVQTTNATEATNATQAANAAAMTYAEYAAAAVDDPVTIEAYVQGKQSWWDNTASIYAQDKDGAYFIYAIPCTEEEYAKLVDGVKIQVSGYKANFNGEDEIADGTLSIVEDGDTYIATPVDVTDKLGSDELVNYQNQKVTFTGLTVAASEDPDGNEVAYLYNYDGSGSEGDDLYFNVSDGTNTYSFTVESYLTDADSDVYKAVKALKVGDTIDAEGFLYWYEGANPHITSVTVK